jgi:hypothetical protein
MLNKMKSRYAGKDLLFTFLFSLLLIGTIQSQTQVASFKEMNIK